MRFIRMTATLLTATSVLMVLFVVIRSQTKVEGFKITGIVQNAKGSPLAGVKVFAFATDRPGPKFRFGETDAEGRFRLDNIREGRNVVYILPEGEKYPDLLSIAGVGNGEVGVDVSEANPAPDVVVIAGEPNPSIFGSVVDKKTKKFDRSMQIRICLTRDPSACSSPLSLDDSGNFSMAVPTEAFTFTVYRGEKTFKLKQKNADGLDDEVLTLKAGERRDVRISF